MNKQECETFSSLKERWRSHPTTLGQRRKVAIECADDLERLEQRVRELRDRCIEGAKLFADAETASVSQKIGEKLTSLLGEAP